MIGWFGATWGAPICEDTRHVPTPGGLRCLQCDEVIQAGDRGVLMPVLAGSIVRPQTSARPVHLECHLRMIIGGLNHLRGQCRCCGGTEDPDPPGMTRREAARAAVMFWHTNPEARNA